MAQLNTAVRTNAISGVIAAVIFVIIAALTGGSIGFIVVGAIIVGVVTFLIAFAIGTIMRSRQPG